MMCCSRWYNIWRCVFLVKGATVNGFEVFFWQAASIPTSRYYVLQPKPVRHWPTFIGVCRWQVYTCFYTCKALANQAPVILLCPLSRRQCISQRKIIFARVCSIKFLSEQSLCSKCLLQNIVSFTEISHGCLFIRYSWAVFWYTGTGLAHIYPVGICTDRRLGELAYFSRGA